MALNYLHKSGLPDHCIIAYDDRFWVKTLKPFLPAPLQSQHTN